MSRSNTAVAVWLLLLTSALLWPVLTSSGYPLARDLVFTPDQPWKVGWLGLGDSPARAVPLDALVSIGDAAVGGQVLARLALMGALLTAGVGAALMVRRSHPVARCAAATVAIWNPFVVERLALGQWALLWAYAASFLIIVAAARLRSSRDDGWAGLRVLGVLAALAPAAITPTGAVIGAVLALVVGARRGRATVLLLGVCVAVQLPWLLPSLLGDGQLMSDPAGVGVFASRSERAGGPLWTLVGLGGIWDSGSVPGTRAGVLGHLTSVMVLVVLAVGWRRLADLLGGATRGRLSMVAAGGLVLGLAAAVPGAEAVIQALVEHVPGAGLLRDAQKWLIPLVVLTVASVAATADRLVAAVRAREPAWLATAAVVVIAGPIALLPDGAAAVWSTVRPVTYPADVRHIASALHDKPGEAASFPWTPYRVYPWGNPVTVYDPASRLFAASVVMSDRLTVGDVELRGESLRSAQVGAVLTEPPHASSGRTLAARGVRWLVVQVDVPVPTAATTQVPAPTSADARYATEGGWLVALRDHPLEIGMKPVFVGASFALYETVGPASIPPEPAPWKRWLVAAVDLTLLALVLAALVISVCAWLVRANRRWRPLTNYSPVAMLHRTHKGR